MALAVSWSETPPVGHPLVGADLHTREPLGLLAPGDVVRDAAAIVRGRVQAHPGKGRAGPVVVPGRSRTGRRPGTGDGAALPVRVGVRPAAAAAAAVADRPRAHVA